MKEVTDFWLTEMKNNSIWLKNETKFKSDETKRAGKAISHADVFGVEGSFRKLDIDWHDKEPVTMEMKKKYLK